VTGALDGAPVCGVLFDYGNTLITFQRPDAELLAAYGRIAEHLRRRGLSPPEAAVLLRDVHDRVEESFAAHQRSDELREINLVAEARHAYAGLGLDLDADLLDEVLRIEQEAWWHGVTVDPEAVPTLDGLRRRGVRVGLCSNAPYRVQSMHDQLSHLGLDRHLDAVTFSGQVGWRKPSAKLFQAAVQALGVTPVSTVMVGDSIPDDVEGAIAAGLRAVLLVRNGARSEARDAGSAFATIDRLSAIHGLLFGTSPI
jgi:putative hydrolase of the HAD superfamily